MINHLVNVKKITEAVFKAVSGLWRPSISKMSHFLEYEMAANLWVISEGLSDISKNESGPSHSIVPYIFILIWRGIDDLFRILSVTRRILKRFLYFHLVIKLMNFVKVTYSPLHEPYENICAYLLLSQVFFCWYEIKVILIK